MIPELCWCNQMWPLWPLLLCNIYPGDNYTFVSPPFPQAWDRFDTGAANPSLMQYVANIQGDTSFINPAILQEKGRKVQCELSQQQKFYVQDVFKYHTFEKMAIFPLCVLLLGNYLKASWKELSRENNNFVTPFML